MFGARDFSKINSCCEFESAGFMEFETLRNRHRFEICFEVSYVLEWKGLRAKGRGVGEG